MNLGEPVFFLKNEIAMNVVAQAFNLSTQDEKRGQSRRHIARPSFKESR